MEDRLEIGVIVKPQGIKGEIKVQTHSSNVQRLKGLKSLYVEQTEYKITSLKIAPNALLLGLFGVTDRNDAETLRGKRVFVNRMDLNDLEKGTYYVVDLIGLTLIVGDKMIGKITEILSLKTDVITVLDFNGKVLRFPFLKTLNANVDLTNGTFTVDENRFNEVVCYEN